MLKIYGYALVVTVLTGFKFICWLFSIIYSISHKSSYVRGVDLKRRLGANIIWSHMYIIKTRLFCVCVCVCGQIDVHLS